MAIISATDFKVQTAAMAAALTAAWKDSAKTEMAAEIKNPHHPLRRVMKFFLTDGATGVITSDDGYVDAAYAGNFPSKGNGLDIVADVLPVLSTATVEDAAPTQIVLTFDAAITGYVDVTEGGTLTTEKEITNISVSGAVMTITVDSAYISTDTILVSGIFYGGLVGLTLTDQAVTNNVA